MRFIPRSLQARTAVVIALAFFVLLSLFFGTSYVSIRRSLIARSDGEARAELDRIASVLRPDLSNDSLLRILSERRSIGESPLRLVLLDLRDSNDQLLAAKQEPVIPLNIEKKIKRHPGEPRSYSTSNGDMRVISMAHGNFILGAIYTTLLLEEAEESIIQVFAYYLAGGLIIGTLGGIFLSKYLIGPITTLALAARSILHRREKSPARLPVSKTIVEVADLAQSINELLDAREHAMELQRNFAADAAHELRTPLTVLKGEIEVELRMTQHDSPQAELLQSNLEEIERLISTVQDLLELAEIEAGTEKVTPRSECSILSTINYAANRLQPLATVRGISIVISGRDFIIVAQEKRITRLIYNLLLNAVQHSESASQVEIRLQATENGCILEVEDHGKGITPERLTHLFERFHRTGSASTESRSGAGLGLAIVKSIADHYGLILSVQSSENTGTTVSVSIPPTIILG